MVDDYIQSDDPLAAIILNDRLKLNECFYYFKNLLRKGGAPRQALEERLDVHNESRKLERSFVPEDDSRAAEEIKRLKLLIQQKDNEMALLVSLIKKKTG